MIAYRVVTPEQLKLGWHEKIGMYIYHRQYHVIRRLEDGNYVVAEPGAGETGEADA